MSKNKKVFSVGERVLWKDPDPEGVVQEIYTVDKVRDDIVFISNDWSEAEVPPCELKRVDELTDDDDIEVKIEFTSNIYVKGKTLSEVSRIFENIKIFSEEAESLGVDFVGVNVAVRIDDNSYSEVEL